jgi:nucleotide-binding universal stress UspA family protein
MAYPFRAILSPIQFDDLSLPALGFAKSIAKDQGATLHLLHVVAVVSALGEPAINAMLHSRAEEKAIEALNDIAAKHLEGVSYVIHTRFATHKGLARAINEVAAEIDADLIVLKTHRPPRNHASDTWKRGGGGALGAVRSAEPDSDRD